MYGEGMTLIYKNGPATDATSQTGTWAEELAERLRSSSVREDRPELVSRKSMRLDRNAPGLDDIAKHVIPEESRELMGDVSSILLKMRSILTRVGATS